MIQKIWNSATRSSQEWPLMLIENFVLLKFFLSVSDFLKIIHKFWLTTNLLNLENYFQWSNCSWAPQCFLGSTSLKSLMGCWSHPVLPLSSASHAHWDFPSQNNAWAKWKIGKILFLPIGHLSTFSGLSQKAWKTQVFQCNCEIHWESVQVGNLGDFSTIQGPCGQHVNVGSHVHSWEWCSLPIQPVWNWKKKLQFFTT